MSVFEFSVLAASSLFVIVDPIASVPAFLAMTPEDTPAQREKTARLACFVMTGVLLVFAVGGQVIFKFFGITPPAFQMAGSLVLLMVALDMLRAQRSRVQETQEETAAAADKADIAVTPLAIPMLSGPGAISTCILLRNQAQDAAQLAALCVVIAGVCGATYLILRWSSHGARWLNPIAVKLTTRIMGLLLAAVAIQFMLNALKELKLLPA